jgi:uncharacterized membrane protein YphA (DoxX/SURF4 family)
MTLARIIEWACRLFIGGLFVVAGYAKLANRFQFELAIESYQILPVWGVIAVARVLPWMEIALGLLILRGWQLRWFAGIATALLAFFLATMAITYSRGVEATCGCFGLGEPVSPRTLLRDTLFFLPAVYLTIVAWLRHRRQKRAINSAQSFPAESPL